MTDINAILTQITKTGLTNPGAASAQSGKTATTGGTGVNFFDMIFSKLTADAPITPVKPDTKAGEQAVANPLLTILNLNTPQATLVTADATTAQINTDDLDLTAEGANALQATLDSLLQGIPADQKPALVSVNTAELKKTLEKLATDLKNAEGGDTSLIATGLTPQDLTNLIEQLNQATEAGAENTLLVGMIQIVPAGPETQAQANFIPRAIIDGKGQTAPEGEPTDDLAAALNAMDVGGSVDADLTEAPVESAVKSRRGDLNEFLKMIEQFQGKSADAAPSTAQAVKTEATPANTQTQSSSSFHGLLGTLSSAVSGLTAGLLSDGGDISTTNDATTTTGVSTAAQLASLVTGVKQASQPHPTTQVIAATLTKGAQSGENKTMTLQLDPPELGRVEIQMHFTKDKSVKTHMVFEKPETMLMMQRDSQVLERALVDAGMDAGGNDLSFELASQDHMFGDDRGNGGNSGGNGGQQRAGDLDADIIESTMLWHVDPETGMQRYNILA